MIRQRCMKKFLVKSSLHSALSCLKSNWMGIPCPRSYVCIVQDLALGWWHGVHLGDGMAWHAPACIVASPLRLVPRSKITAAVPSVPPSPPCWTCPRLMGLWVPSLPGYVTLASGSKDRRPPPQALPTLHMRSHKRILFRLVQTFDTLQ